MVNIRDTSTTRTELTTNQRLIIKIMALGYGWHPHARHSTNWTQSHRPLRVLRVTNHMEQILLTNTGFRQSPQSIRDDVSLLCSHNHDFDLHYSTINTTSGTGFWPFWDPKAVGGQGNPVGKTFPLKDRWTDMEFSCQSVEINNRFPFPICIHLFELILIITIRILNIRSTFILWRQSTLTEFHFPRPWPSISISFTSSHRPRTLYLLVVASLRPVLRNHMQQPTTILSIIDTSYLISPCLISMRVPWKLSPTRSANLWSPSIYHVSRDI